MYLFCTHSCVVNDTDTFYATYQQRTSPSAAEGSYANNVRDKRHTVESETD